MLRIQRQISRSNRVQAGPGLLLPAVWKMKAARDTVITCSWPIYFPPGMFTDRPDFDYPDLSRYFVFNNYTRSVTKSLQEHRRPSIRKQGGWNTVVTDDLSNLSTFTRLPNTLESSLAQLSPSFQHWQTETWLGWIVSCPTWQIWRVTWKTTILSTNSRRNVLALKIDCVHQPGAWCAYVCWCYRLKTWVSCGKNMAVRGVRMNQTGYLQAWNLNSKLNRNSLWGSTKPQRAANVGHSHT